MRARRALFIISSLKPSSPDVLRQDPPFAQGFSGIHEEYRSYGKDVGVKPIGIQPVLPASPSKPVSRERRKLGAFMKLRAIILRLYS